MREADANLPFPPLTPPNEIVGGVFGNPKHDQLREDFDTLKKDVDRLIDWCNKRRSQVFDIARMKLEPGDVILIRSLTPMRKETREEITKCVSEFLPGHKCMIVDPGFDVAVIGKDANPP